MHIPADRNKTTLNKGIYYILVFATYAFRRRQTRQLLRQTLTGKTNRQIQYQQTKIAKD